jgi:hypothetical protein
MRLCVYCRRFEKSTTCDSVLHLGFDALISYGLGFGVTLRSKNDKYAKDYNQWLLRYQTVELEIEKAQKLKELGLQAEPEKK